MQIGKEPQGEINQLQVK